MFLCGDSRSRILNSFGRLGGSRHNVLPITSVRKSRLVVRCRRPTGATFSKGLTINRIGRNCQGLELSRPRPSFTTFEYVPIVTYCRSSAAHCSTVRHDMILVVVGKAANYAKALIGGATGSKGPCLLATSRYLGGRFRVGGPSCRRITNGVIYCFGCGDPRYDPIRPKHASRAVTSTRFQTIGRSASVTLLRLRSAPPTSCQTCCTN